MTTKEPAGDSADGQVILGGGYAVGDLVGTGGTYTVYEATRLEDAATGAEAEPRLLVKVLHPHLVDDEVARAALAREIAASAQVDHPGVAKVLDTGEDEVAGATVPWLLMRRLPGQPLSELAADGGLPWREALTVVGALLDGLRAVHDAGLVHRDVSPRNVVVDRHDDGTMSVGLLDLGLATVAGGEGDGDVVTGSAAYMSPEQAQGRPLDARSDLYSVGALTYFALTGSAPYERARPTDVLRAHVHAPVPAPSARRADVPVLADRFVTRAMAKNPARRFATAGAMGATVATLIATTASLGVGSTPGAHRPRPDRTAAMENVPSEDPARTAAVGSIGAAAGAADVTTRLSASGDEVEATRPLDEVVAGPTPDPGAELPAGEAAASDPSEPGARRTTASSLRWVALVVLVLVLAAATVGAITYWPQGDGNDQPVVPVTHSPSPSTTRTPSTTAPPAPTNAPTSRPARTQTPTPSPTPTPTPSGTPTDTSTPTETPTDPSTPTETSEPTPTETTEPSSEPTPTETTEPSSEPTVTDDPTQPGEAGPTGDPDDPGSA
ncbi:protein kinase [Isoptericola sp. NEAU-Y5]|uniref:non-specific serine/threonine protein kinase n=1 Tax=Isoptericola luteus TaxID=2879484 RepID=A0ABS7ZJ98_9MICO|nr:serine/threonine-protein kinase [Isoptericola sp. NEAU-Y5]MCA5894988.1 protein kinase [Isoptericola sp. NEAU-Y5]